MKGKKLDKMKLWVLVWIIVLVGFPAQLFAANWQMEVKNAAVVGGEYIQLSEIARPLQGCEESLWKQMANSTLCKTPDKGSKKIFYRRQLNNMLSKYLRENAGLLRLPQKLIVQNGGNIFTESDLQKKVRQLVKSKTKNVNGDVQLRDYRLPGHICLENEGKKMDLSLDSRLSPGRNTVRIKLLNTNDKIEKRFAGSVFVDLWKEVPCAAQPIQRHETLAPSKITTERKNLAYLPYEIWEKKDGGGPWRLKKSIGAGSVLYKRILESVPLIGKGESVNLLYQGKAVRLEVPARALEEGDKGESLQVKNLRSDKRIRARVRDKNTVIVR